MTSSGLATMSHAISSSPGAATAPLSKGMSIPQSAWKDPNPNSTKTRIPKSASFSESASSSASSSSSRAASSHANPPLTPLQNETSRKKDLIMKTDMYLKSPIFRKMGYFEDMNIKVPTEAQPLALIEQTYELVRSVVTMESKRMMTHHCFEALLSVGEGTAVNLFQVSTAVGFADFCISNSQEFQPEMEEIAIEFGNSMIPDPKMRMGIKIVRMWKTYQDEKARGVLMTLAKTLSNQP